MAGMIRTISAADAPIGRHKLDAMVAMTYEKNSSEGINEIGRASCRERV